MEKVSKFSKALVKGVQSGDCLLLSGKIPKNGDVPEELTLYLSGVQAPHCGNPQKPEEDAYAWESRDYLRKKLAGKVVTYKVDFKVNERSCGQVVFDDVNIAVDMVSKGFAKVGHVQKANESIYKTQYWSDLQDAESDAKAKSLNIWSNEGSKHKRSFHNITDDAFDMNLIKKIIEKKETVNAIIEFVFSPSFFVVYIPSLKVYTKVNLRFIAILNQGKEPVLYKTGKAFVERIALHQDIKMNIYGIDESKVLLVDIECGKGSLAGNILKEGYGKIFINNNSPFTNEELSLMKTYQQEAKSARLRIWKNEPIVENKIKSSGNDETIDYDDVKCFQVHSGDSISIVKKEGDEPIRLFLSNVKAPAMAKPNSTDPDQPWAFQAKEFLRKNLVGKTLRCVFDYAKTIPAKEDQPERKMKFYTVYYTVENKKTKTTEEKCANIALIENGLANISMFKIDEGEPTKEIDSMRAAESQAKSKKVGLYSLKTPPLANYSDLISAGKNKKKEFTSFVTGLSQCACVVEYCFSGSKFKLRIEKKQCMIPISMTGVKTFGKDKNNTDLIEKYYQQAVNFVNDAILQRDGVCDIVANDRVGNYFGHLFINGKNFGIELIKRGLAVVNEQSNNPNPYLSEFEAAEKEAKEKQLGIWKENNLGDMLKYGENAMTSSTKLTEVNTPVTVRVTEFIDFANFFVNIQPNTQLTSIEKVLATYDASAKKRVPLALPIKIGTLCAAKYPEDDKFYRAIVKSHTKDMKYEVEFIDYGNVEYLPKENLIKLDGAISSIQPQAQLCEFAYLKYSKNSMKKAIDKFESFGDIEKTYKGKIVYTKSEDGVLKNGIIIYNDKKEDIAASVHADLIKIGYAKLNRTKTNGALFKGVDALEKKAKDEGLGLWAENEETDYDENDVDY